jgi:hypothetical protein
LDWDDRDGRDYLTLSEFKRRSIERISWRIGFGSWVSILMSRSAVVGGYGGGLVVWFDGGEHSPWLIACIKYDARW